MSSGLQIPVFDTDYEPRYENRRRVSHERHERDERHENREHDDPLDRLPGQMANIAGAAVIGSMGIGLMGMMLKK